MIFLSQGLLIYQYLKSVLHFYSCKTINSLFLKFSVIMLIWAAVIFIILLIWGFHEGPHSPPSRFALEKDDEQSYRDTIQLMWNHPKFLRAITINSFALSIMYGFLPTNQILLQKAGLGDKQTGVFNFGMPVVGLIVGTYGSTFVKKIGKKISA